jgi:hypothetical protein
MLSAAGAAAQVAVNQAARYLHPTAVTDARAVWLDPSGPAAVAEASVYLELVVRQPGAAGRLGQVNAGFSSRGLSFGYQRDAFDGVTGHTYRLGFASSAGGLSAGAAVAFYRGGASSSGWDLGVRYAAGPRLTLGGVVASIGRPEVRGVEQPVTYVPSVTLTPMAGAFAVSAHARMTRDSVLGYAFGARLRIAALTALVRLDTDRAMRRAAFALGFSVGTRDLIGAVTTLPGDVREVETASLYALSSRALAR